MTLELQGHCRNQELGVLLPDLSLTGNGGDGTGFQGLRSRARWWGGIPKAPATPPLFNSACAASEHQRECSSETPHRSAQDPRA